jgi:sugar phosphate permease
VADFDRPLPQIAYLVGYLVLTYGISSFLVVLAADVTGRRPLFLVTSMILLGAMIWAARGESISVLRLWLEDVA